MIPLCLDEGVGTIIWSPLARGRLARTWDQARTTTRSETDGAYADMLYAPAEEASNRAIIDAVGQVAQTRGVSRAQVALAWLRRQPVVIAPLVGAGTTPQIDDAVASLDVELTADEAHAARVAVHAAARLPGPLRRDRDGCDPRPHPGHGAEVATPMTARHPLRRGPLAPSAAASFSARHAVGTDATGPNSSRWSPVTRKSLITRAPSAIAHARSANTRPRSCPPAGDGSAADSPGG